MIHFEGAESFSTSPAATFAKLSDAGWLAQALPDAQVSRAEPDQAEWKIRPKLTFLSGSLDSVLTLLDRTESTSVRYRVASKGVGSGSTLEATLTFQPTDGGTTVTWSADLLELTGLLKLVPPTLLQATAKKVIADVWESVRKKLAE